MNDVIIRPYDSQKDRSAVIECITILQDFERTLDSTKFSGAEMAPGYLDYLLTECKSNDGQIFVAETNGHVVGFSCVWLEENGGITVHKERIAYFSDLCVKPEFRRKGIASRLIQARKDHAVSRGIKKAQVYTLANNPDIQKTLRSQGFKEYEIVWEALLG